MPSLAESQLLGWCAVALVNAVLIATTVPMPLGGPRVRAYHHLFDAGQALALGVASFIVVVGWLRLGLSRRASYAALFGVNVPLGWLALREDLSIFSGKLAAFGPVVLWQLLVIVAIALGIAAAAVAGRWLSRGHRRWLSLPVFFSVAVANHFVLPHDYPGIHLYAGLGAVIFTGAAIANGDASPSRKLPLRLLRLSAAGFALWSILVVPTNAVGLELYRSSASVVAPFLARLRTQQGALSSWKHSHNPWFNPRTSRPPISPGNPRLLSDDGIVLLVTVDCLRSDVIMNDALASRFPTLRRLRNESVAFVDARSTAPGTLAAIASLFSSRYYSELYWTRDEKLHPVYHYPHLDPTPRFPEILARAGVMTSSVQGLPGILGSTGLVRGFKHEKVVPPIGIEFAGIREMLPDVLSEIRSQTAGPLFLYAHFADPHEPYTRGGGQGKPLERYLAEVGVIDAGMDKLIKELISMGVWDRTTLIFSADHGEAFEEHDTKAHATTLYDELLRVPLLIRMKAAKPRLVREPVSLIDIGPTVLDLFGQPTPGIYKGQSLVPYLRGENPRLARPVAAESSRFMRAMLFPDRIKVIEDRRKHTIELYDLRGDRKELVNIFDQHGEAAAERLAQMRRFFAAHELKREGYELPFVR